MLNPAVLAPLRRHKLLKGDVKPRCFETRMNNVWYLVDQKKPGLLTWCFVVCFEWMICLCKFTLSTEERDPGVLIFVLNLVATPSTIKSQGVD